MTDDTPELSPVHHTDHLSAIPGQGMGRAMGEPADAWGERRKEMGLARDPTIPGREMACFGEGPL